MIASGPGKQAFAFGAIFCFWVYSIYRYVFCFTVYLEVRLYALLRKTWQCKWSLPNLSLQSIIFRTTNQKEQKRGLRFF